MAKGVPHGPGKATTEAISAPVFYSFGCPGHKGVLHGSVVQLLSATRPCQEENRLQMVERDGRTHQNPVFASLPGKGGDQKVKMKIENLKKGNK